MFLLLFVCLLFLTLTFLTLSFISFCSVILTFQYRITNNINGFSPWRFSFIVLFYLKYLSLLPFCIEFPLFPIYIYTWHNISYKTICSTRRNIVIVLLTMFIRFCLRIGPPFIDIDRCNVVTTPFLKRCFMISILQSLPEKKVFLFKKNMSRRWGEISLRIPKK